MAQLTTEQTHFSQPPEYHRRQHKIMSLKILKIVTANFLLKQLDQLTLVTR